MKIPPAPHRWRLTPSAAVAVQRELAPGISRDPPQRPLRLVAGLDLAFTTTGERCIAAAVLWDVEAGEVVEERIATRALTFPYVPGLLSFREGPAALAALRRLGREPDAILCDGHGLAHPRRFGLACHLGLIVDLPAVGCAKSLLVGAHEELPPQRGARRPLFHRGEEVGAAVRTRDGVRPVYVSIGHRVDLDTAVDLVLACGAGLRLPEPTRRADRLVARVKRSGRAR